MADQIVISMDLGSHKVESQLKGLYNTLKSIDVATTSVKKSFTDLPSNKLSQFTKLHKSLNATIKDGTKYNAGLNASYDLLKQKAAATRGVFSKLSSEMKNMSSTSSLLANSMRTVFASMQQMFMQLPRGIINMVKLEGTYMGFRNALGVAEGTIGAANASLQTSIDIAKQLKLPINVVTKEYTKFMNAVRLVGFDTGEAVQAFTDLSKAARVLNLDQVSLSGMFLALEQMVSKGTVSMEELRRQLGNALPGAVDLAALAFEHKLPKGLKNTSEKVAAFIQLVREGKVNSVEFLRAFTPFLAKRVEPFLGEALNTSVAALADLNNEFHKFKIRLGGILGVVIKPMVESLTWLTEAINNLIGSNSVWTKEQDKVTYAIAETNTQISKIKTTYDEVASSTKSLTTSMGGIGIAMVGMTGGAAALRGAFIALKAATLFALAPISAMLVKIPILGSALAIVASKIKIFTASLLALNPATIVLTAVATAVIGISIALNRFNKISPDTINKLKSLKTHAKEYADAMELVSKTTNIVARNLEESSVELHYATTALDKHKRAVKILNIQLELQRKLGEEDTNLYKQRTNSLNFYNSAIASLVIVVKNLTDTFYENRDAFEKQSDSMDPDIVATFSEKFTELSAEFTDQYHKLILTSRAYQEFKYQIEGLNTAEIELLMTQWDLNHAIEESQNASKKYADAQKKLLEEQNKIKASYDEEILLLGYIIDNVETAADMTERYNLAKKGMNKTQINSIMLYRQEAEAAKELARIKKEQDAATEALKSKETTFDEGARVDPLLEYLGEAPDKVMELHDVYINAFASMEDAMVSMMTTGKVNFADMAKSILADLSRMIAKQIIFNAVSSMFSGGMATAAPVSVGPGSVGFVGAFERGTNYVPRDGLAYLHKGEAVVPAKENNRTTNNQNTTQNIVININGVKDFGSFKKNESQISNGIQKKLAFANRNL